MIKFITHSVKEFISVSHLICIYLLFGFSWVISMPPIEYYALNNSVKLLDNYNLLLYTIGFGVYILSILNHMHDIFINKKFLLVGSHLTENQVIVSMLLTYLIVFNLLYVIPAYSLCSIQQLFYAPDSFSTKAYIIEYLNTIIGYFPFWVLVTLSIFIYLKDVFSSLITVLLLYLSSFILSSITNGILFYNILFRNIFDTDLIVPELLVRLTILIFLIIAAFLFLLNISSKLYERFSIVRYKKGFLHFLYSKVSFHLSAHHSTMMGYRNQNVLMVFVLMGTIFLLPLFINPNLETIVLFKIYYGVFIPLLYSFYQPSIIQIDLSSNMIISLLCRQVSYAYIVFNRLVLLLLPQLIVIIIMVIVVEIFSPKMTFELLAYLLILNVFHAFVKVLFSSTRISIHYSNILIITINYILLREDVQTVMNSNQLLIYLNFLSPIVSNSNEVSLTLWLTFSISIIVLSVVNYLRLSRSTFLLVNS